MDLAFLSYKIKEEYSIFKRHINKHINKHSIVMWSTIHTFSWVGWF